MSRIAVKRALVSVFDKSGLVEFAKRLINAGVEIVSSGGTASALSHAGVPVTNVAAVTGFPEILSGRVKTLHPMIHGAVLADPSDPSHRHDLEAHGIRPVQLVVVNLYPFEATVAQPGVTHRDAIEHIDIGGPTLIRAAAKNHAAVGVVISPDQYDAVAGQVEAGGLDDATRLDLARHAFFATASYDAAIVGFLEGEGLHERLVLPIERRSELRYGENPHQAAAAYAYREAWWTNLHQLQGKQLSFNNLADTEAAWRLAADLESPAAVVVKHTNPCGVAERQSIDDAVEAAWACDPVSAFGGVVAMNRPLTVGAARFLAERFIEVVIAPEVALEASEQLAGRSARVLEAPLPDRTGLELRGIEGGFLAQERDIVTVDPTTWTHVAGSAPTNRMLDELALAWTVAAHAKSNAVVIARDRAACGIGVGDQSRVGAARRAVERAGERANGAVAASDAFFPFRDGLDTLADAGCVAVVEPGGSKRDPEIKAAADERGVTLMFTGRRHFRH